MTTERVLQIFVNALPHVSIAFFVAALTQILYVTLSDIGKSPKVRGEFCYSPKTALIPQTSHLTVIKTTNSSSQQENKFVKKSKPSPRRIIASYYMYSMAACLPLMSTLHLPVVNEPGCVVEGYFPRNIVPLVEDVPADRTEQK